MRMILLKKILQNSNSKMLFIGIFWINIFSGMNDEHLIQRKRLEHNSETQSIISPKMSSFLKTASCATVYTLSFAHLLSRIEAGTLGCDCKLMLELVGSCFVFPTASNWGDILEKQT